MFLKLQSRFKILKVLKQKNISKKEYLQVVDLLTKDKNKDIACMPDDDANKVLEKALPLKQGNILMAEKVFEWNKAVER